MACWARCPLLVIATSSVYFVAEQLLAFESSIVFGQRHNIFASKDLCLL